MVWRLSALQARAVRSALARGAALLMAHAYKAIGECKVGGTQLRLRLLRRARSEIEELALLALRCARSLSARSAWSMCTRCASATDTRSIADRATIAVVPRKDR
eukprot:6176549-Prymnesium_polylepis.1